MLNGQNVMGFSGVMAPSQKNGMNDKSKYVKKLAALNVAAKITWLSMTMGMVIVLVVVIPINHQKINPESLLLNK